MPARGIIGTAPASITSNNIYHYNQSYYGIAGGGKDAAPSGFVTHWFYNPAYGQPRNVNIFDLRQFAKSNYVKSCVSYITKQVMRTPWSISLKESHKDENEEDEIGNYKKEVKFIKDFLNNPTTEPQSFKDLIKPFVEDLAIVDAGVWTIPKDEQGRILEIWARDGGTFLKNVTVEGRLYDTGYFQYSYQNPLALPKPFPKENVVYYTMNPQSYSSYGESPVQWLLSVLEILEQATRFNKELYSNNNIPDGIVTLPNANDQQLDAFKSSWKREITGKPHKMMITNSEADFKPFNFSSRDMEWLDGQKWYMHLVCAAFGVTPAVLGFEQDVNKASQEGQERVSDTGSIKPYLDACAEAITKYLIPGMLGVDPIDCIFEFTWNPEDQAADAVKHDNDLKDLQASVLTINEVREERGLDAVEWGDKPMAVQAAEQQQEMAEQQTSQLNQSPPVKSKKDEEKEKPSRGAQPAKGAKATPQTSATNKKILDDIQGIVDKALVVEKAKEEIVDEATPLSRTLTKEMNGYFNEVIKILEFDAITKSIVTKDLSTIFTKITNIINISALHKRLKPTVESYVKIGIKTAEQEINVDIGFTTKFELLTDRFTTEQVGGYQVAGDDGIKQWNGLHGVLRGYEDSVKEIIKTGVNEGRSLKQVTADVRDLQKRSDPTGEGNLNSLAAARRIARTETNRMISGAKLESYKESGLKIGKRVVGPVDGLTSKICKRIMSTYNKRVIGLTDVFLDESTGAEFNSPPFHPNCRHTIISDSLYDKPFPSSEILGELEDRDAALRNILNKL